MAREPRFICDAMLGGLARWLRAAGYRAEFDPAVRDGELVRRAYEEGLCLLTSDSGIMDRYAVARGLVHTVFVPRGLTVTEQLAHVLGRLWLPIRPSRCMDCGGELAIVTLAQVREHVPPKVQRACRRFYRCRSCGKVYWHGTHWESIRDRLRRAALLAEAERAGSDGPT